MPDDVVVVERLMAVDADIDLHDCLWELALDQRAFGPRRVIVALTDERGRLLELAHADRTDPPELAFGLCLDEAASGAAAAVAYCDEPVDTESPPEQMAEVARRWSTARHVAREFGVHLVDWIGCDDQAFRSFRLACDPDSDGWDLG
jgi:mevalonate pyrophosphate decarboxylase